jgi:ATP phosphoribosyltransferase regulatory subunit
VLKPPVKNQSIRGAMSSFSSSDANNAKPDARAEMLVSAYERAGYARVLPAILQPADPFLDLSGEDIRRSLYLTTDAEGRDYCLRPDFTIAVSRDYLASPDAGALKNFCYLGPVFRQMEDGPGELPQIGVESFGRRDIAARSGGARRRNALARA